MYLGVFLVSIVWLEMCQSPLIVRNDKEFYSSVFGLCFFCIKKYVHIWSQKVLEARKLAPTDGRRGTTSCAAFLLLQKTLFHTIAPCLSARPPFRVKRYRYCSPSAVLHKCELNPSCQPPSYAQMNVHQ